jgi:hypothetical protein
LLGKQGHNGFDGVASSGVTGIVMIYGLNGPDRKLILNQTCGLNIGWHLQFDSLWRSAIRYDCRLDAPNPADCN